MLRYKCPTRYSLSSGIVCRQLEKASGPLLLKAAPKTLIVVAGPAFLLSSAVLLAHFKIPPFFRGLYLSESMCLDHCKGSPLLSLPCLLLCQAEGCRADLFSSFSKWLQDTWGIFLIYETFILANIQRICTIYRYCQVNRETHGFSEYELSLGDFGFHFCSPQGLHASLSPVLERSILGSKIAAQSSKKMNTRYALCKAHLHCDLSVLQLRLSVAPRREARAVCLYKYSLWERASHRQMDW